MNLIHDTSECKTFPDQTQTLLLKERQTIFQPFEPVVEIAGEPVARTRQRIDSLIELRKACFRGRVDKFFQKQV